MSDKNKRDELAEDIIGDGSRFVVLDKDYLSLDFTSLFNEAFEAGFHEGQEAAFRKVVELIREVSTQEQDIFSKNDYVRYLLANKEKILGDEC